jgi:hypothetical protein
MDNNREYRIAVPEGDYGWHVLETIHVASAVEACAHAEQHYGDADWYVLNANDQNVNGGPQ